MSQNNQDGKSIEFDINTAGKEPPTPQPNQCVKCMFCKKKLKDCDCELDVPVTFRRQS